MQMSLLSRPIPSRATAHQNAFDPVIRKQSIQCITGSIPWRMFPQSRRMIAFVSHFTSESHLSTLGRTDSHICTATNLQSRKICNSFNPMAPFCRGAIVWNVRNDVKMKQTNQCETLDKMDHKIEAHRAILFFGSCQISPTLASNVRSLSEHEKACNWGMVSSVQSHFGKQSRH